MTYLVPAETIEKIIGLPRMNSSHLGKLSSLTDMVYVMHSHECLDSGVDLRECEYSLALDKGLDMGVWYRLWDQVVVLEIEDGLLYPKGVR